MSLRGEITIACDVQGCHAEEVINAETLASEQLWTLLTDEGWRIEGQKFICPQCREEGKQP